MRALETAWEGQPDLTLPAFIGVLHNRGMSWATTEDELLDLLAELTREHPARIDDSPDHPLLFTTSDPEQLVTLVDGYVVVRSASRPDQMPAAWAYSGLRMTGPGRPLVISDDEGVEHRFGVVRLAARIDAEHAEPLHGLTRDRVGGARWLVMLTGGRRAVVGPRIRVWEQKRRDVQQRTYAWERIIAAQPGEDMKVAPASGGEPLTLGPVERVLLLES